MIALGIVAYDTGKLDVALQAYLKAAEQGHALAQFQCGKMCVVFCRPLASAVTEAQQVLCLSISEHGGFLQKRNGFLIVFRGEQDQGDPGPPGGGGASQAIP